jgi:hypothetical protein
MNCLDLSFRVVSAHAWPIDASMFVVDFGLDVEDPSNATLSHLLDVFFCHGVGSDENSFFSNLLKIQVTNEICITFLDVTVD